VEDILVKFVVVVGSCLALVLLLAWYTCEPDDR
jgi:hypothetical protein